MIDLHPMFDDQEEHIITMGMYPLCGAMCEALGIPEAINEAVGPRDPRAVLDVGLIVKAMVINILDKRSPLYHFADAFRGVDCEVIFGEGVYADLFTEDRLGDALDLVSELDHRSLATSLSIRNLKLHGVPVHSAHIDTTNASLSGEFEVDEESDFKITFGNPKDKRKDRKLITFASAVQQDGLPLFGEGLSGNASDVLWFRRAMDEMSRFQAGDLNENPILVMDASGSTIETFDTAFENEMPGVIRLSKRFNITRETIDRACQKGSWQEVGTVAEHNRKQASEYRIYSEKARLGKYFWRIVIVQSTALQRKKDKNARHNLKEGRESLEKIAESLAKKEFETPEEARRAAEKVLEERSEMQKLIDCEIEVCSETSEKYARPGRPTKDSEKIEITTYRPQIILGDTNKERYKQWLEYNSCFALVSNVPEDRLSDQEILFEYKGQWKIEEQFKFIKVPRVLEPICLDRPNRIQALIFILWLAVMVASYLRHRMYLSLKRISANYEQSPKDTADEVDTDSIYEQVIGEEVVGCILAPGGRKLERPTFKVMSDIFQDIQIKVTCKNGKWIRKFPRFTNRKTLKYIIYTGFHPAIYLEPFHPGLDLWPYSIEDHAPP